MWQHSQDLLALGQLVVFGVGVVLAYLQLRGLRRQQEAELIQRIFERLNSDEIATALDFVYNELSKKLADRAYVREIHEGRATAVAHPELRVMHFFNGLGLLVHGGMVGEYPIVPVIASPCIRSWDRLAPVVELMRRRYPHAYTPFESLVVRARAIDLSAINERFRAETPHLRSQWEGTARDIVRGRISLLDEPD